MVGILGKHSAENGAKNRQLFPEEVFSKIKLSSEGQQKFDGLLKVFEKTSVTACHDFVGHI